MSAEPPSDKLIRTFLFTDIEGSTRLWEHEAPRMRMALERHDEICRNAVLAAGGQIVKTTGDGIHAAFEDALPGVLAALQVQRAMAEAPPAGGLVLKVRAGVHLGECEARDGDFYGPVLNRAARVMSAAHGGQTLVTQAVAERVAERLTPDLSLLDLGTVRLRDLASPERVFQLQHAALRAAFPPLRSLEATPNNLTQQLNSFVGRERELKEVRELLAKTRLLTLLGMGGIGKSRLSVQLGAELLDEYPDGVWLVELAPLADPLLVPQALASVLGVKEERGASVTEALLAYVRDKTLLVILDNCEHVVHACADLAKRLLQTAPGVRVLTSSRDVLQVAGETVYQVPTLGVPAADEDGGDTVPPLRMGRAGAETGAGRAAAAPRPARPGLVGELGRHAGVRLFLDRVGAVQPTFKLDADNAAAVASICRRLDGIPLALELAAARTRALSVQAIAERLKDRFRLLVTGDQTVLPRQRTLRALIDWSFELLSEPERMLFRRLAVFAGGWTLESAEAVCAGDGLDGADVLDLLAQLVQKSLVVMERDGARYRMLETVRAYAAENLVASEGEEATRRRHVTHYVHFAEQAREHLLGSMRATWLPLVDQERENLLSVHAWCGVDAVCRNEGLLLVFSLRTYWVGRGLLSLGFRVTVDALERTPPTERTMERCRALCDAGVLAYYMGRYPEAHEALVESHGIASELGDKDRLSAVLPALGFVLAALGQPAKAMATHEAASKIANELGRQRQEAIAINALAQLHRAQGSLDRAHALYIQAGKQFELLDDKEAVAITWLNLAMVEISRSKIADAIHWLRSVNSAKQSLGSLHVENSLIEVTAGLCAVQGSAASSAYLLGAGEHHATLTGIRRGAEDEAFLAPLIKQAEENLGTERFEAHKALGRAALEQELSAALLAALAGRADQSAGTTCGSPTI